MTATQNGGGGWRDRTVGHGAERPDDLMANPRNWRVHPANQQQALAEVLDRVGWVQDVIVNRSTGHVVDGHLRIGLAIARGEESIPVSYVELDEDEEKLVLASLDPLAGLAAIDQAQLQGLVAEVELEPGSLSTMLDDLVETGTPDATPSQAEIDRASREHETTFAETDDGRQARIVDVTCPECGKSFGVSKADL